MQVEGDNWPFLCTTRDSTSACSFLKCWSADSTSCSFSSNHCSKTKSVKLKNQAYCYSPSKHHSYASLQQQQQLMCHYGLDWIWLNLQFAKYSPELYQYIRGCLSYARYNVSFVHQLSVYSWTHHVWLIHFDGHFTDSICCFVDHFQEAGTAQSLSTHSPGQLKTHTTGHNHQTAHQKCSRQHQAKGSKRVNEKRQDTFT